MSKASGDESAARSSGPPRPLASAPALAFLATLSGGPFWDLLARCTFLLGLQALFLLLLDYQARGEDREHHVSGLGQHCDAVRGFEVGNRKVVADLGGPDVDEDMVGHFARQARDLNIPEVVLQRSPGFEAFGLLLAGDGDRDPHAHLGVAGDLEEVHVKELLLERVPLELLYHHQVAVFVLAVYDLQVQQDVAPGLAAERVGEVLLLDQEAHRRIAEPVHHGGDLSPLPGLACRALTGLDAFFSCQLELQGLPLSVMSGCPRLLSRSRTPP